MPPKPASVAGLAVELQIAAAAVPVFEEKQVELYEFPVMFLIWVAGYLLEVELMNL